MSLLKAKRVIRYCRGLQKNGYRNKSEVNHVAKQIMDELVHLNESYIRLYKESKRKILEDRDPISRTRALSFQFVKDRVFQDFIRSRLILSTTGIGNDTVQPFVLLIDDYLTELTRRVFVGINLEDINCEEDRNEKSSLPNDSSHMWDTIASFKIKLAHAFDNVRRDNNLDYSSFKADRVRELESKVSMLNAKLAKVRRGYDRLFIKALV